jgi:DUF1365 family protein
MTVYEQSLGAGGMTVYEGTIRHRRFAERGHEFCHRIAMGYSVLDDDPRVRVLTLPRRFGKRFSPVSFYYRFDNSGVLERIVAEVTSTPWREKHSYVLERGSAEGPVLGGGFDKQLHVSPFMGMDQRYEWRASTPGDSISVHIESYENGELAFDATLSLQRSSDRRARTTSPERVLALIYGHALALKLKGVPIHRRPSRVPA